MAIRRSRIQELLVAEGLRWREQETWFGQRVDPDFAAKGGAIEQLYTAPPEGSAVVCLDELGPESAKSYRGKRLLRPPADADAPAPRAPQEIDYGRRGGGYVFGAFRPATGEALTAPYDRRTAANFVDFLTAVDRWLGPSDAPISLILDNLSAHRAPDVLLFAARHPAWTFVYQPVYAAWLNLIEPWWKALRSLALKGRRFETWEQICDAVREATAYWNAHKRPFVWGRRRRHRPRRKPGLARPANVRPT